MAAGFPAVQSGSCKDTVTRIVIATPFPVYTAHILLSLNSKANVFKTAQKFEYFDLTL